MRTFFACLVALLVASVPSAARASDGRRAYVVDARLSALRVEPSLVAPVVRRLGAARMLSIVGRRVDATGTRWLRVAVTRRTRGWVLADAVASPGDAEGEGRLVARLAAEAGLARLRLARLALDRFPRLRSIAGGAAEEEAAAAAVRLTRLVLHRLGAAAASDARALRALMLSDTALDPFSRLGVELDVDVAARAFVVRRVRGVERRETPVRPRLGGAGGAVLDSRFLRKELVFDDAIRDPRRR
jgi:hypothetical protein